MHKIRYAVCFFTLAVSLYLGCWQNHVALFHDPDPDPIQVYPVQLDLLPQKDQLELRNGIPVSGTEELSKLLEDLLS